MKKEKTTKKKKYFGLSLVAWFWNLFILAVAMLLMYWIAPGFLSGLVYNGLISKLPFIGVLLIAGSILWAAYKQYDNNNDKIGRAGILTIFALAIGSLCFWAVHKWTGNITYKKFADEVELRENYLPVDKNTLRYTPRKVAHNKIENVVSATTEEVLFEHTQPFITDDGFAFAAAITLDGARPVLLEKNPGLYIYHDSYHAKEVIERVDQDFEIGVGMEYLDNAIRQLFYEDFFAVYDQVHYLALDSLQPRKFTGIAPKMKYKYSFPFFFAKYWAGVTLIDSDGTLTDLTVAEAQKDPRLKGKWIYPMVLAKQYVNIQDYKVGFLNSFTAVDGKLSIPKLKHNEYPLVIYGEDGQTYFVIDTEPQGSGKGMFRMYFINATTGEMSYYEPPPSEPAIGPLGALSRVYSLNGYNWVRDDKSGSSGNQIALEPVYLTKTDGDLVRLFYKFSVTSLQMTEVSSTVVVEAREGGLIEEFDDRDEYESWLVKDLTYESDLDELEEYINVIRKYSIKSEKIVKRLRKASNDSEATEAIIDTSKIEVIDLDSIQ